ncbi:MAG: hypothetical protein QM805_29145 [Pseudomonas sp.]
MTAGADPRDPKSFTEYDVNAKDGSHAAPVSHANRHDCVKDKQCTEEQELQNFANWFTYYRMRESLTKAAVSESFVEFKDKLRVSWGRIDNIYQTEDRRQRTRVHGHRERRSGAARCALWTPAAWRRSWVGYNSTVPGAVRLRTALDSVGSYYNRNARPKRNQVADPVGSPWLTDSDGSNNEPAYSPTVRKVS